MAENPKLKSLQDSARRHVQNLKSGHDLPAVLPASLCPSSLSKEEFLYVVQPPSKKETEAYGAILVSEACSRNCDLDLTVPDHHEAATRLQEWTIDQILPTEAFASRPPFGIEDKPLIGADELRRIVRFKEAGLHLLSNLLRLQQSSTLPQTANLVACLASFTDPRDSWTNEESRQLATSMLSTYVSMTHGTNKQLDFITEDILIHHIKPLFLKSRTPLLTPAARKAISPLPGRNGPSDLDAASKPWKFRCPHIVTIFQWVLSQLDGPRVEKHWPLIIPPLLTIIDDVSVPHKIKGCSLLLLLLKVCPANLLERSGLGEIFHTTLVPYLLYLPSLTPEEESIPLLDATYTTLIALTLARYSTFDTKNARMKALDAIFRYGILKGYAHAGENVRIARILMEKSTGVVDMMGTHCVKHLKDLLPITVGILTAPFATAYPPLLQVALQNLRMVLVNAWPRIAFHTGDVLGGLIICWRRLEDEEELTSELVKAKGGIEEIIRAISGLLGDDKLTEEGLHMLQAYCPRSMSSSTG